MPTERRWGLINIPTRAQREKEAERQGIADAINRLSRTNPELARFLGASLESKIEREGAMAEPEAAGIPAPIRERATEAPPVTEAEAPTVKEFLQERFKTEETLRLGREKPEEAMVVSPGQRAIGRQTGRLMHEYPYPEGGMERVPDKPWEYQRTETTDSKGMRRVTYRQLPEPLLSHARRLVAEGVDPYSKEFVESMGRMGPTIVVPGVGAAARSDVAMPPGRVPQEPAPGGPPGATRPRTLVQEERPVPGEIATRITGASISRQAAAGIQAALQNPEVQNYLGPLSQYRSLVQRYGAEASRFGIPVPQGYSEAIPPDVVKLEQDLALLKNYVINLRTGAQLGEKEATRIMKELPDTFYPGPEFEQRLQRTMANVAYMEQTLIRLALTGNQQARLSATQLGLPIPGLGPQPAGVSGQTPQAAPPRQAVPTPQTPPPSQAPSGAAVPHFGEWRKRRTR